MGVARGKHWHDRGIHYAQAFDPTNAQMVIYDRRGVVAHLAGADGVEGDAAAQAKEIQQVGIARA